MQHQQREGRRDKKKSTEASAAHLARDIARPPVPHSGGIEDKDLMLFYITYDRMVSKADQMAFDAKHLAAA